MVRTIAVPAIRARIDPAEALAKAEARLRGATTFENLHRAAKAMDEASARVLSATAQTQADTMARNRATAWVENRDQLVADARQHLEDMETYRNRRVAPGRPYARKAR